MAGACGGKFWAKKMSYNVPLYATFLQARIRALRSKVQGWQNAPE
jgi:hypothetical protein